MTAIHITQQRQLLKLLEKLHQAESRAWFLNKCLESKIAPATLHVKPPQNGASARPDTQNRFRNVAHHTSSQNVKVALQDAKRDVDEFGQNLDSFLDNQEDRATLENFVTRHGPRIMQNAHHKYSQRLAHLKMKNGIVDDAPIQGIVLENQSQKKKTRRFMKRSRFRRWKKRQAAKRIDLVFNYSDFQLTPAMVSLLNRGMGFAVTPEKLNVAQLHAELDRYDRRMLWKYHWFKEKELDDGSDGEGEGDKNGNIFKLHKTNMPSQKPPKAVSDYLSAVRYELLAKTDKKCTSNLPPREQEALKELKRAVSSGQIVIKKADKGGGVCVMNMVDYIAEMTSQLTAKTNTGDGEIQFYVPAQQKDLGAQVKRVNDLVEFGHSKGFISDDDKTAMRLQTPKGGRLYGQPKVHKGIKPGAKIPPCRPIISNSGSNTEKISSYIDHFAKAEVFKLPSYIEDTPHILRVFEQENQKGPQPKNSFPVTVDVVGLYTNIPTFGPEGGIQAFSGAMNRRENQSTPTWYLLNLLKEVLSQNIFEFNDKFYRQVVGTAMGTAVAPTYANLFMGWLEETKLLGEWTGTPPRLWKRFIDDIMFIWDSSVEELELFISHLNAQHPSIKFTATYDSHTREIPFLDTNISLNDDGQIVTDLYKKPTAKAQYLLPTSCHPGHVTKNIPFSLGYRLLRICSSKITFNQRLEELRQDLLSRQYPPKIVDDAFKRVRCIPRSEALKKVIRSSTEREPLVITYHPQLVSVTGAVRKYHQVMTRESQPLARCFKEPSLVAYKRPKNLGEELIRAKVSTRRKSKRNKNGFTHCGRFCMVCRTSQPATSHQCHRTGEKWDIVNPINCLTSGVIYLNSCRKCPAWTPYIGETGRRFCDRVAEHRAAIQSDSSYFGGHFSLPGHSVNDMVPLAIEKVRCSDPKLEPALRKRREKLWINRYDATTYGCNKRE